MQFSGAGQAEADLGAQGCRDVPVGWYKTEVKSVGFGVLLSWTPGLSLSSSRSFH